MSPEPWIGRTFVVAGVVNLVGVPFITRAFTNDALSQVDPAAFSTPGMLLIMAWGLAYVGVSGLYDRAPWCVLAFAFEKAVYAGRWVSWVLGERPTFGELFETDAFAGLFYLTYGVIDGALGVFFVYVLVRVLRARSAGEHGA